VLHRAGSAPALGRGAGAGWQREEEEEGEEEEEEEEEEVEQQQLLLRTDRGRPSRQQGSALSRGGEVEAAWGNEEGGEGELSEHEAAHVLREEATRLRLLAWYRAHSHALHSPSLF